MLDGLYQQNWVILILCHNSLKNLYDIQKSVSNIKEATYETQVFTKMQTTFANVGISGLLNSNLIRVNMNTAATAGTI